MKKKQESPKTPYRVQARDFDHLSEMVKRRDATVARALAEAALDSAEGGVGPIRPYGMTVEFDDGSYAVMEFGEGQDEEIRQSLVDSLPDFEKREWYELCARVKAYLQATEKAGQVFGKKAKKSF